MTPPSKDVRGYLKIKEKGGKDNHEDIMRKGNHERGKS